MTRLPARLAGSVALLSLTTPALADEGMWTFDQFPADKVKAAYGVTIDQAWLDKVRAAAVRLSGGCSASVVSGKGLVLTNNHCVVDCAEALSGPGQDFYSKGYLAAATNDEKKCAGMQAEILEGITEVTGQVQAAGKGKTGQALVQARTAASATIEGQGCPDSTRYRCQVVELYHGGQFKLYKYRKFSDVRLVFSPGVQAAFFGGDPDNFNFPRYDLDSAFIRLYENGQPVATPNQLIWNSAPPKAGDPVFVAGNPGGTDRQLTIAQLETQRDLILPIQLLTSSELRGRLIGFSAMSDQNRQDAQELLFGLENGFKVRFGRLMALNDKPFLDRKRAEESELKAKLPGIRNQLGAEFGDPWGAIRTATEAQRVDYLRYMFVEQGTASSQLWGYARRLVRAAAERAKPSADRLPGYADSQLPLLEKRVLDEQPVHAKVEQLVLEYWLSKAREYLTADAPEVKLLLGNDSPEALSAKLATSKLGDAAYRKQLWDGGPDAIRKSDDPMIQFMLRIDPAARRILADWNNRVDGPIGAASEQIAKARFAAYGTSLYPDATFTLRLSYGKIDGWSYRGRAVPPFTYFKGLWTRATGQPPFDIDPRWLAAKGKLNPGTVFNMSTTIDIIGGNSGSPLINAKGEVIGAVFDGNIHSLGGDYGYDGAINRGIAVSTAAVTEALRKVYGATALADELAGK